MTNELQEADCCYNCESMKCVEWSSWGKCEYSPRDDKVVYWHQVCDRFSKRTGELEYTEG